jgi:hypothetical protein
MSEEALDGRAIYDRIVNMIIHGLPSFDFSFFPMPPTVVVNKAMNETLENVGEYQKLGLEKQRMDLKKEKVEIEQLQGKSEHETNENEPEHETNENEPEHETNENEPEHKSEHESEHESEHNKSEHEPDHESEHNNSEHESDHESHDIKSTETKSDNTKMHGGGQDEIHFTKEECSFF